MNDYLILMCAVITAFIFMFLAMGHEQDLKADCIKSATNQHYSVDKVEKLCK
jgi:hypothetical protein